MSLTELSSPIRLYWDLDPCGTRDDHARICSEIIANKFLSLQITVKEPDEACRFVLEQFKGTQPALSLVVPAAAWNDRSLRNIQATSLRLLLLQTSSLDEVRSIPAIMKQIGNNQALGIAFGVTRENFRSLPEVLQICIDHHIPNLVLPMQRLTSHDKPFSFSAQERRELTTDLSRIDRPSSIRITIHDPFLWRAFFPAVEFPGGGCQAANTMLSIAPDGKVYPCPTMPVAIGSLRERPLKEIIASEAKKEARRSILAVAEDCRDCGELKQCKGGCRGRVFAIHGSFFRNDPACR